MYCLGDRTPRVVCLGGPGIELPEVVLFGILLPPPNDTRVSASCVSIGSETLALEKKGLPNKENQKLRPA